MASIYNNFWKQQGKKPLPDFSYKWPVIKKLIPSKENLTILDFGCGQGVVLEEMMKINPQSKYIGIDISSKAIKFAKKKLPKVKFYITRDGQKLRLKNKSVDFILAADVIEHVYDTEALLSELARVLKTNGKILISTPYHGLIKNLVISLIGFEKVFNPIGTHIRFFTKKSLFSMLIKANLDIKKYGYFGRFYPVSRGFFVLAEKI